MLSPIKCFLSDWKAPDEVMSGVLIMIRSVGNSKPTIETFCCRGSQLDIHLRQSECLFLEGSVMELVVSDDDEFDTLIEAVEDIRIYTIV